MNNKYSFTAFELQLLKLIASLSFLDILNIYRPPSSSVVVILDELTGTISTIHASSNYKLMLCGDLNCPDVDSLSVDSGLVMVLNSFGIIHLVGDPTRDNILQDVLATNDPSSVSEVRIQFPTILRSKA